VKTCPNCGFQCEPTDTECPKCGIVFKKWEAVEASKKALERQKFEEEAKRITEQDAEIFAELQERDAKREKRRQFFRRVSNVFDSNSKREGGEEKKLVEARERTQKIESQEIQAKKVKEEEKPDRVMEGGEDQGESKERILCRDGTCIGVIGPDGLCSICGLPYSSSKERIPKFRVVEKVIGPDSVESGCGAAILAFIIGGLVSLIPVVGWILGPFIIFAGAIIPFKNFWDGIKGETRTMQFIEGPCPYCTGEVSVHVDNFDEVIGRDCPICKKRFVVREKQFWAV